MTSSSSENGWRSNRICFTINNPEDDDIFWNDEGNLSQIEYLIVQEERGENGTLHYQGFMILKNRLRLSTLRERYGGRAHYEMARGTNQEAADYCRKEDTYTGGLRFEYGKMPARVMPKKRNEMLADAAEVLENIKVDYQPPEKLRAMQLLFPQFIQAYKLVTESVLGPYRPDLRIITLVGPPGCGKSHSIEKYFPGHGKATYGNGGLWFGNPTAEVMVFEEFHGQVQLSKMLEFLDPYPNQLEVKGHQYPAMYRLVILTSNVMPHLWYANEKEEERRFEQMKALWDRLNYAYGNYIPARTCGACYIAPYGTIDELRQYYDEVMKEEAERFSNKDN